MSCGCGGTSGGAAVAYRMQYTDQGGTQHTAYASDLGGYGMLRSQVEAAGGKVLAGRQVTRAEYDAWAAAQSG